MGRFKYTQLFALILFCTAWMLQSVRPVIKGQLAHHNKEAKICHITSLNAVSCKVHASKGCTCDVNSQQSGNTDERICGCSHHGSNPVAISVSFKIEALSYFYHNGTVYQPYYILLKSDEKPQGLYVEDIFHPPRLSA